MSELEKEELKEFLKTNIYVTERTSLITKLNVIQCILYCFSISVFGFLVTILVSYIFGASFAFIGVVFYILNAICIFLFFFKTYQELLDLKEPATISKAKLFLN